MAVLKALVIALISFNSQLFGQPLLEDKKDRNLLDGNKKALGQGTRFSIVPFTTETVYANFSTVYVRNVSLEQQCLFIFSYSETNKLFGQPLLQDKKQSNLPRENQQALGQSSKFVSVGFPPDTVSANFDTVYVSNVSLEQQRVFVYSYNETNKTTAIRVSTFSKEAEDNFPVTFVVREQEDILSWMVPVSAGFDYKFQSMDRTLCPMDETKRPNLTSQQNIFVMVATMSSTILSFNLKATILTDFELEHGVDRELTASPSQPQYYMYTFPKEVDTVLLRVTSNNDLCAVISVQPIKCPVLDLDEDIGSLGKHQTMTTKAAFFLEKRDYHRVQAFYVIVLVKPKVTNCAATDDTPPKERLNVTTKNLTILITNTISKSQMICAILTVIGIYIGVFAAFVIFCFCLNKCLRSTNITRQTESAGGANDVANESPTSSGYQNIQETSNDQTNEAEVNETCGVMSNTFGIYILTLITVALFYGIPAAQLVFSYQKTLRDTGDEDMCYYNFDCAYPHRIGPLEFSAFNNIISNIGYLILGLLFIIIVKIRSWRYEACVQENRHWIPKQCWLLYAMGGALMVEGIMSAIYHLCPTSYNYQFDTTFMYIILCLCVMKIFEIQLPSTQPKAPIMFFCMAWITFSAVLGMVVKDAPGVSYCYAVLGPIPAIGFGFLIYSNCCFLDCCGRLPGNETCRGVFCIAVYYLIYVGGSIGVLIKSKTDFATYLLGILLINFGLYLIVSKAVKAPETRDDCNCRETCKKIKTWVIIVVCLCAAGLWGGAGYYFFSSQSSWASSPETSRQKNKPCTVLDFFDNHDMWHFLSSGALFLSLLMLLAFDDDLIDSDVDLLWTELKTKLRGYFAANERGGRIIDRPDELSLQESA